MNLRLVLLIAVCAAGGGVWFLSNSSTTPQESLAGASGPASGPAPTSTENHHATVFQKALWARPSAQDQILNAERREWADEDGVNQWQWFLEVQPSPSLRDRLIKENAFGLAKAQAHLEVPGAPEWFIYSSQNAEAFGNPASGMFLAFTESGKLFATGTGGGFRHAVKVTSPTPKPRATREARLPRHSPPNPDKS